MKKNFLSIAFLLSIGMSLFVWRGCHNEKLLPNNPHAEFIARTEKLNLLETNKKLLVNFFDGTLTDLNGNKIPNFSVSIREGMLAFNKKEDMQNYVYAIDILKGRWDYKNTVKPHLEEPTNSKNNNNNTPETVEGYFETLENVGDDVKNAVDLAIAFSSLRKQYINWEWSDPNWKTISVIFQTPICKQCFHHLVK